MVPALKELLPRSGLRSDVAGVGSYGGLLFAFFLVGWGCAFQWWPTNTAACARLCSPFCGINLYQDFAIAALT